MSQKVSTTAPAPNIPAVDHKIEALIAEREKLVREAEQQAKSMEEFVIRFCRPKQSGKGG